MYVNPQFLNCLMPFLAWYHFSLFIKKEVAAARERFRKDEARRLIKCLTLLFEFNNARKVAELMSAFLINYFAVFLS